MKPSSVTISSNRCSGFTDQIAFFTARTTVIGSPAVRTASVALGVGLSSGK